jgi:cytochrome c oxidase cbb3-type subunit 2
MAQQQASKTGGVETNNFLMIVLILITVSFGALVEIVPLFFQKSTTQPIEGLKPYTALQLAGRDIYEREGCYLCHSQMIRPFRSEALRYGPYSVAGESVYDHPFLWGSKRNGPDLARVGGRYSDDWHRVHLNNPRDVVPESIMPAFPWLDQTCLSSPQDCKAPANHGPYFPWQPAADTIQAHMKGLRTLGVPYTDEDIAKAPDELKGKTEMDAVIAYLQGLGIYRQ